MHICKFITSYALLAILLVLITENKAESSETDVLVELPNGVIRGKQTSTKKNKTYFSFQKVPYASPPIGDLRFKPPIPPDNWEGILDATSNRVICYQVNRELEIESEDCLYLNIYTPRLPINGSDNDVLLPVIFYIHGGGFIQGTCLESICGPEFFIEREVVVVTINYRLGPFGFLSTQDEIIPGNNGLKDQHLGIKWTHDNIKLFGGDPHRIVIVGQSAGAASVAYQFLNKKSEGLFSGAICQSGSFLSPWSFQRRAREIAFKTAGFINESFAHSNNSEELYKFLLSASAEEIDEASYQVHQLETLENRQINQGYFYAPVLEPDHEDAFITRKMYGDLKSGNFVKVPILIGITSEESIEDAADLDTLKYNMESYDTHLDWLVPDDTNIQDDQKRKMVGQLIRSFYTNGNFSTHLAKGIKYFSDTSFTRSVIKHAELQSKFTDVYFYQFSYDGELGNVFIDFPGTGRVAHTEEVRYMWGTVFEGYDNTNSDLYSSGDYITHERLLTLWTNFAGTLNPTPEKSDLLQNIEWPPFITKDRRNFSYLDINSNLSIKNFPKIGTYLGWNMVYDIFGEGEYDTY